MLRLCRSLAALGLALACAAPALAQGAGAPASINAPYRDGDFERWRARFETEGREVYDRREDIVAAARVRPDMAIADVGAGSGLFTRLFARATGAGGRVYAVDVSPGLLEGVARSAKAQGLGNVVAVLGDQDSTRLAPASVDLVFVCDAYHHFERPPAMLASIRAALRPGGTLVVVDFERALGTSPSWILTHVRAGKEVFRAEIEAAGFRFVEEVALMKENYVLRFARD